jgi:hypothetical protein
MGNNNEERSFRLRLWLPNGDEVKGVFYTPWFKACIRAIYIS